MLNLLNKLDRETLSFRLTILRVEKNLPLNKVAEGTRILVRKLDDYEQGMAVPTIDELDKLAKFYGTTTDYILRDIVLEKCQRLDNEFVDQIELLKKTYRELFLFASNLHFHRLNMAEDYCNDNDDITQTLSYIAKSSNFALTALGQLESYCAQKLKIEGET